MMNAARSGISAAASTASATASARTGGSGHSRPLRVVSLLPSATENFFALLDFCRESRRDSGGAAPADTPALPELVGRSHECDFPSTPDVLALPVLTAPRTAFTDSADTHKQVREALQEASSLYHLDAAKLAALAPDVILTQSSCKVCSIDLASVESSLDLLCPGAATSSSMDGTSNCPFPPPGTNAAHLTRIVTTNPFSLKDALVRQFEDLGVELGIVKEGKAMAKHHLEKLKELQTLAKTLSKKNSNGEAVKRHVLLVEWMDPLFIGKHGWMRDIIEAAGGHVVESIDKDQNGNLPHVDAVVVACCGLSLEKTRSEIEQGKVGAWWHELFVSTRRPTPIYLVDGTSMFSRPTRRLLVALEWLVHVLHEPDSEWVAKSAFPFERVLPTLAPIPSTNTKPALSPELAEIEELHRIACDNKQATYIDPATGFTVMTAYILKERQVCCGNGCRHCPYAHANVKDASMRKNSLDGNVFLRPRMAKSYVRGGVGGRIMWPEDVEQVEAQHSAGKVIRDNLVLFWSGGKDSFLALSYLYKSYAEAERPMPRVVLLTTIDPETNTVPIQNIDVSTITAQATALELPLCFVSVGMGDAYASSIKKALKELPDKLKLVPTQSSITGLAFGDLHLEDIRAWREKAFGDEYSLVFPVWKKDYRSELLPELETLCRRTGARLFYSNVDTDQVDGDSVACRVGSEYDWKRVDALNRSLGEEGKTVDLMGESGEFHTCVKFPSML